MGMTRLVSGLASDARTLPVALLAILVFLGLHADADVVSGGVVHHGQEGIAISSNCSVTCLNGLCDAATGNCVLDWGSGVVDDPITVERVGCPKGFYSGDCTKVCPDNCAGGTCRQADGTCDEGCAMGFTGEHCSQACAVGFHGDQCLLTCPENCLNNTCNARSGACSDGCLHDFWGSDCSLGVQMSRNTAEERRTFYQHLSAEGKSVLIYLLTSRYEHALSRAQYEIEQAVQDRNDLRHLLSQG